MSVYAHRTEDITGPEKQEGANEVGGGIRVRGRNGDGNEVGVRDGDVDDDGDVDKVGEETGTGTGVEANEGAQDENGNGGGSGNGAGTGAEVQTRGQTRDGNRDGSRDRDEISSVDGNGDENENGDGNEGRIGEGEREAKKYNKPPKNYKRDQTLLFRTRCHLYRQGVALASTRQLY